MAKFRKLPVVIEAWQWKYDFSGGDPMSPTAPDEELPSWMSTAFNIWPAMDGAAFEPDHPEGPRISITTLFGVDVVRPNDWIIQNSKSGLNGCDPDIFAATYEPVEEAPKE